MIIKFFRHPFDNKHNYAFEDGICHASNPGNHSSVRLITLSHNLAGTNQPKFPGGIISMGFRESMHLSKYLNAKKTISAILSSCEAGFVTGEQAASAILATIVPTMDRAIGMELYFSCAKGWLTQILIVEPKLSVRLLNDRLRALREISPEMRQALGGISGRLSLLCRI